MRIVDIAAAAGVSPSTVSRVIRGSERISPKTAAQVRAVMKEMGFHRFRRKDPKKALELEVNFHLTKSVAILSFGTFSEPEAVCCSSILNKITDALSKYGFTSTYLHLKEDTFRRPKIMDSMDGVILLLGRPSRALLDQLVDLPIISLFCPHSPYGDQILSGHHHVGQTAGEYLLSHKVKHWLLLNALPEVPSITEQAQGFRFYAQQQKISAFTNLTTELNKDHAPINLELNQLEKRLESLVDKLGAKRRSRIGVFIPNDWMTALVYRLLTKKQIKPSKFIFVSSGNIPAALAGLYPRPATVDIGMRLIAEHAVNLLLVRIQSGNNDHKLQIAIQPKLIEGDVDLKKTIKQAVQE